MKKWLAFILTAAFCLTALAGCGSGGQQSSQQPEQSPAPEEQAGEPAAAPSEAGADGAVGKLIVGLDDTFAPMGFRDDAGNLVGFDIDLANAVGEEMGVEIVFQPIEWTAKEMELAVKNIDCVWNGMSRNSEREETMTLSQHYLNNKIVVMTSPDVEITSLEQLADYQVGTQAGSSGLKVTMAHEIYPAIRDSLHEYTTYDECILDMQAGRIQAMIVDEVLGQYKNNNLDTKFNVAPVDFGDDFYVIGFRRATEPGEDGEIDNSENEALCRRVEKAIKAVIASGKGAEISEKWFGENLLLDIQ